MKRAKGRICSAEKGLTGSFGKRWVLDKRLVGWGRFDVAIKDLGGVAFRKVNLGGTTREEVDLE